MTKRVAAVVLAAASSSRMGRPKQLIEFEGQTLIRRTAQTVLAADVGAVVVTMGVATFEAELHDLKWTRAEVENPREGQSQSVHAWTRAVKTLGDFEAILFTPCDLPRLSSDELMSKRAGESSATVRRRVVKAREKQLCRMRDAGIACNARMGSKAMNAFCEMDAGTKDLLKAAIAQFNLSRRGYDRTLKVSRTIADREGARDIEMHHVAEAINYRAFDRKLFG